MIRTLTIQDFVVVEGLEVELEAGLNVLSGGSGEGKTLVLEALRFLLGGRPGGKAAAARLVREGAAEARVEAELELPPALRSPFAAALGRDAAGGPERVTVTRTIERSGRGRARLDGRPLPMGALKSLGALVLEPFGQGEAPSLAQEWRQRAFLDGYAGLDEAAAAYGDHRERTLALARERDALRAEEERLRADEERFAAEREALEALRPEPGEYEALLADEERFGEQGEVATTLAEVTAALEEDGAPLDRLQRLAARLRRAAGSAVGLDEVAETFEEGLVQLTEATADLARERDRRAVDPRERERVAARLGEYRDVARRLGAGAEALAGRWSELGGDGAEAVAGRRRAREAELASAWERLEAEAVRLTEGRREAAAALAPAVEGALPELGLASARVTIETTGLAPAAPAPRWSAVERSEAQLQAAHPAPHGRDRVTLRFAAEGGAPAPLSCASGGELSRLFLALGREVASRERIPVIVFDEVDQNVGARLGPAVGDCLARMASGRQLLVVTHLAPVAARADRHLRIVKEGGRSRGEALDRRARVEELALMIKGSPVTRASREQAEELLAEAQARSADGGAKDDGRQDPGRGSGPEAPASQEADRPRTGRRRRRLSA